MEIPVDVRHAAEIPDHFRALDLPDIPDPVVADVERAAVTRNEETLNEFLLLDGLHGRGDVAGAEAGQHAAHGVEELGLLILAEVGAAEAGQIGLAPFDDAGGAFVARLGADEGLLLLL